MLNIIYSYSKTVSLNYIYKNIEKDIKPSIKTIIMVPDNFYDFFIEKSLEKFESYINQKIQILTFKKLYIEILSSYGPCIIKSFNDNEKLLLIEKILFTSNNELKILKKKKHQNGTSKLIFKTICELKKNNINLKNLKKSAKRLDNKFLKEKIEDLTIIFDRYEKLINKEYKEYSCEENNLKFIFEKEKYFEYFKNKKIYLNHFKTFSEMEYEFIFKILKYSDLTLVIETNNIENNDIFDFFKEQKNISQKIINKAKLMNVKINNSIFAPKNNLKISNEISFLQKNFFDSKPEIYKTKPKNIKIFNCKNIKEETELCASIIVDLIASNKYKLNDINILVPDISKYENIIKVIFKNFAINTFIDYGKNISQTNVFKFIVCIFDTIQNPSPENFLLLSKSGFINVKNYEIYEFENYLLNTNLPKFLSQKGEWKYNLNKFDMEKVNNARKSIILPILDLKEYLPKHPNTGQIIDAIMVLFDKINIVGCINENIKKNLNKENLESLLEYKNSFEHVITMLNKIKESLGELHLNYNEILDIFISQCREKKIKKERFAADHVAVHSIFDFKILDSKIVFLLGMNKEDFPKKNNDSNLFSNSELKELSRLNIKLYDNDFLSKFINDKSHIYEIFSIAKNKLYILFSEKSFNNKISKQAEIIDKITKNLFPKIKIMKKNIAVSKTLETINTRNKQNLICQNEKKQIDKNLISINQETVKKLFGSPFYINVTKIERYNWCSFAFFMQYGLYAKSIKKTNFGLKEVGIILHEIISEYFKDSSIKKVNYHSIEKNVCFEDVKKITEKILKNSYEQFNYFPKINFLKLKILNIASETIWTVINFYKQGAFKPLGFEIKFGRNGDFDGEKLEINGNKIILEGVIDRVDILCTNEKNYITVLDYKSSFKNFNKELFEMGVQIQPFVYEQIICKKIQNAKAAGVFYMTMIEHLIKFEEKTNENKLEENIKDFKMKSIVVENDNVLTAFNKNFNAINQNKEKNNFNCKTEKFINKKTSQISENEMLEKLIYSEKKIYQTIENILNGDFEPANIKKEKCNLCQFCEYKHLCGQLK
ncbi:MAG: exodeoxyribonuclease V subunit gamma [Clostridiales bacterium]|jgi:ATP-dependent helicase/nuclease subunit B|nr:exodeoxyribonuclease V subunit gamma [Clostridiales bacterium]